MPQYMDPIDPDEIKDYKLDWNGAAPGPRLASGETISTSSWSAETAGITLGNGSNGAAAPSISGTSTIVWVINGTSAPPAGSTHHKLLNTITTSGGRKWQEAIYIPMAAE